ncbi:pheromone A receptor-domain-containing protein [Xylariaceae sp. FL0662B]|nr:pheromone A receptor-domain-containing protein [Xylariaceae sp. FL0662B]
MSTVTPPSPEMRYAPNPSLQANMVTRVLFAIIGTLFCWVPFRLLYRNGHTAAVVLIADVALLNTITVLNSLIWRSDNWDDWWDGTGLCDVEIYLLPSLDTVYSASIFAIVLHLAQQVKLMRAARPTQRERKRRAWIQAAIIFPVPIIQLLFTWFIIQRRYEIYTLIGCVPVYNNSWPSSLVYDAPSPAFVLASVPFAFLSWKRYRAISKTTREALKANTAASARANRTRLRLYNMSLSILCVYLPVTVYMTVSNIQYLATFTYAPYDYAQIHWGNRDLYPWDAVLFVPSWGASTLSLNRPWVPIATTVVIVAFFGTTRDALDMYRRHAVALGLGCCFPALREPYDPDKPRAESGGTQHSWVALLTRGSGGNNKTKGGSGSRSAHEAPILPTSTNEHRERAPPAPAPPTSQPAPPTPLPPVPPIPCAYVNANAHRRHLDHEPEIPPRGSSLRRNLTTLTPTLPSFASLRRGRGRGRSTSAQNSTASRTRDRSQDSSSDSAPMLPLQTLTPDGHRDRDAHDSPYSRNRGRGRSISESISGSLSKSSWPFAPKPKPATKKPEQQQQRSLPSPSVYRSAGGAADAPPLPEGFTRVVVRGGKRGQRGRGQGREREKE